MPSKKQVRRDDPHSTRQKSSQPSTANMDRAEPNGLGDLPQRLQRDRGALTSGDLAQLQRTVGNRAATRLVAKPTQIQLKPDPAAKESGPAELVTIQQTQQPVVQRKPGKKTHMVVGGAIGSIVPILGTALGAFIGYRIYKHKRNRANGANNIIPMGRGQGESIGGNDHSMERYDPESVSVDSGPSMKSDFVEFLATLRHGSAQARLDDSEERTGLTKDELQSQGLALLPMLQEYVERDHNTKTIKQFEGQARAERTYRLVEGRLVSAVDKKRPFLTTTDRDLSDDLALMKVLLNSGMPIDEIGNMDEQEMRRKGEEIGGSYIFVMNSNAEIFAGEEELNILHHSSFLAGGAVAAAGYIRVRGGVIESVNNISGHYRPGPAYLWQALVAMQKLGVDLTQVQVTVRDVKRRFRSAAEFVEAFNPSQNPKFFDTKTALQHLNG